MNWWGRSSSFGCVVVGFIIVVNIVGVFHQFGRRKNAHNNKHDCLCCCCCCIILVPALLVCCKRCSFLLCVSLFPPPPPPSLSLLTKWSLQFADPDCSWSILWAERVRGREVRGLMSELSCMSEWVGRWVGRWVDEWGRGSGFGEWVREVGMGVKRNEWLGWCFWANFVFGFYFSPT